jgi:hypothetical protein
MEHLPHDFLPNDQRIIHWVEELFTRNDLVAHEVMRKIIEVENDP